MQEEPRSGGAALTGIGVDGEERSVDRLIEVSIRENDIRTLAAEFEGDLLDGLSSQGHDPPTGFGFAGERNLVDQWAADQGVADFGAWPGHDVDYAVRDPGVAADFTEDDRGHRGGRGRLKYQGVAGGERRSQFPGRHQQREVPGHDLGANSDRFAQRVIEQRSVHRDLLAPELGGDDCRSTRSSWPMRSRPPVTRR